VDIIKISAVLFMCELGKTSQLGSRQSPKAIRAFAGGGLSSHTGYYRAQTTGHKYIIYDVIYALVFLRALFPNPYNTLQISWQTSACIFDVKFSPILAVGCYVLGTTLCISDTTRGRFLVGEGVAKESLKG
jgi:hypothetical protein